MKIVSRRSDPVYSRLARKLRIEAVVRRTTYCGIASLTPTFLRSLLGAGMVSMIGISMTVLGQDSPIKSELPRSLLRVEKASGWAIPLFDCRGTSKVEKNFLNVKVVERRYEPAATTEQKIELFSLKNDGTLDVKELAVDLREISSLEVEERIFAYHVTYLQYGLFEKSGKGYFGPLIQIYYVDENGDGVFETRQYFPTGMLEKIPEWIENGAKRPLPDSASRSLPCRQGWRRMKCSFLMLSQQGGPFAIRRFLPTRPTGTGFRPGKDILRCERQRYTGCFGSKIYLRRREPPNGVLRILEGPFDPDAIYSYDGEGRRVKKVTSTEGKLLCLICDTAILFSNQQSVAGVDCRGSLLRGLTDVRAADTSVVVARTTSSKKKSAFEGVRRGKSKKLWMAMPKHPASDPSAMLLPRLSEEAFIVLIPFLNSRTTKAATHANPNIPPSESV